MTTLRGLDDVYRAERATLADYACFSQQATRVHPESVNNDDPRTPYQHDRDRIQHSVAFRRLQYKTQVYAFHEGDFYRTRLTHSIEVAQIAQGLARRLGANGDLATAISLAHDIGHPPFGHAGEITLKELMESREGSFEHNVQALRTVDELEARYPDFPGLNLTLDTREGIAKHFTAYDKPEAVPEFSDYPNASLEAQLSSIADLIAYCTHDVEDALRTGIVKEPELSAVVPLWKEVISGYPGSGPYLRREQPERESVVKTRTAIRGLIHLLITDAANATAEALSDTGIHSPQDIRIRPTTVVKFSEDVVAKVEALRLFLYERVYYDPKVLRMTHKGQMILQRLWEAFMDPKDARGGTKLLPVRTQERLSLGEPRHRVVCDYLAGMTDRHAMDLYNVLYQAYDSSLHSFA